MSIENLEVDELLATNELNRFCKEFNLLVEIDKISDNSGHLIYRVVDKEDGNLIKQIIIEEENITEFENNIQLHAGTLLNKVSQLYPKKNVRQV